MHRPSSRPAGAIASALERPLRRLAAPGPALAMALAIFLVGLGAQELLFATWLRPAPSHATRNGVSAALGVIHGHGISVADVEAEWLRAPGFDLESDLLALYDPDAERGPAHEPLPGVVLAFVAVAKATGSLHLRHIVQVQIVLHALLSALLFLELRHRHPLAAVLAGTGWALFLPQYRVILSPGHDALTALTYLACAIAFLRYHRTAGIGSLLAGVLLCGLGLWFRSFFFLLPPIFGLILLFSSSHRWRDVAVLAIVVAASSVALSEARNPSTGTTHRMVRGGLWHNFWTGAGQFENDLDLDGSDDTVRMMAERLSGKSFDFPNYQYDAEYNRILEEAGRAHVSEHPGALVRNAIYRGIWLVFPSFTPSGRFAAALPMRLLLIGVGVPISLLGIAGFFLCLRREPAFALILLAPWLSLTPLAAYMVIAKVPTQAYFGVLALAAVAIERLLGVDPPPGSRPDSAPGGAAP